MIAIRINRYSPSDQYGIDKMMQDIQNEFKVPITGPKSAHIPTASKDPHQQFWVAHHQNKVVGTIGINFFAPGMAEIKRMMVLKHYRGSTWHTAKLLMDTALEFAVAHACTNVVLGTMSEMKAAQNFYLKYGFIGVQKHQLPQTYSINPIDSLFYQFKLTK